VQSDSALVELDTEGVVAEITRMGEGLVEKVERGMGI
jgi:U3 small nucleolar RNA-associated protein 22